MSQGVTQSLPVDDSKRRDEIAFDRVIDFVDHFFVPFPLALRNVLKFRHDRTVGNCGSLSKSLINDDLKPDTADAPPLFEFLGLRPVNCELSGVFGTRERSVQLHQNISL